MEQTGQRVTRTAAILICLALCFGPAACKHHHGSLDVSMYQHRDTKNLVHFVYKAAQRLAKRGATGIEHLRKNRHLSKKKDMYLYIYDTHGNCLFHAGMQNLEGKNLFDVTDKNGKPIYQLLVQALANPDNPHAWVHYSWWEPGKFYPAPKSSCHFKVTAPDGQTYIAGGGLTYPHEEREFIRIIVDQAVRLLREKGGDALDQIADPVSQYNYREVRVFVLRPDGELLISPDINSDFSQTNLLAIADETGHKPFQAALADLAEKDTTWQVFMAKNRYKREFTKKSLYMRKTTLNGQTVYVAAITDLPEPPF